MPNPCSKQKNSQVNQVNTPRILKNKHAAVLFSEDHAPNTLKVNELSIQTGKLIECHQVESTENRARVYYVMSTNRFRQVSDDYVQFQIPNIEFNKIVTMLCILSGSSGGIGEIIVIPSECEQTCAIRFFIKNNSGCAGGVTIHTFANADTVPLIHMPKSNIHVKYFLTYLKRSQNLFIIPPEHITLFVSSRGILLQIDQKDNCSTVIFISDVSNVDVESYA